MKTLRSFHTSSLFAPTDTASLAAFRVTFGLVLLWEVLRFYFQGWIQQIYMDPIFHFTYFGFEWVRPWPGRGMLVHFFILALAAWGITLGLYYRICATVFFLGFSYVFLLESARYLNHFYLVCLLSFLMILVPAHYSFSMDLWRNPSLREKQEKAPYWPLWMLRTQIGLVYFFAALAKVNGDWLRGEPMRSWLLERRNFPLIGIYFDQEWMVYAFTYGGLLIDLLMWPLLSFAPTRRPMFALGLLFHLLNAKLFGIGIFPWMMMGASLLFFSPSWPRTWLPRLRMLPGLGLGIYEKNRH